MRLVKFAVGSVGTLVIAFIVIAMFLPRTVTVARSTTINVPAASVYTLVNSFERFPEWSPWHALDPNQRIQLEGPRSGVGATMIWASTNPAVGAGRQEIITTDPDRRVVIAVAFDGFPNATSEITLFPTGDEATLVGWTLITNFGYRPVLRWIGLFFDGMVGPDYERGLTNLKQLAEAEAR